MAINYGKGKNDSDYDLHILVYFALFVGRRCVSVKT